MITPLPIPPSRQDPTNFSQRADDFMTALPAFATETNATAVAVDSSAASSAASAVDAAISATAANASANVVKWVSGTTYAQGDVTWSPINFFSYRRKIAGAGTNDPSVDSTNWALVSGAGDVSLTGIQTLTNKSFTSVNGGQLAGMRNRIINGDMRIDQRNGGGAVVDSTGASPYVTDRWQVFSRTGATVTSQRVTSGAGSSRLHLASTITSAKTPISTDQFRVAQSIEGLNVSDLWSGTTFAKTVTLSFETCHSVTGTFSGALFNAAFNRSFVFTYTQNAATIWESKSITIQLDSTGTWATDNTAGLTVSFDYGSGSNFQTATINSWQSGLFLRSASSTTLVSTADAVFRLQAVQLETGTVATPFEQRIHSSELALCQRYYESVGLVAITGVPFQNGFYKIPKRAAPTIAVTIGTISPAVLNSRSLDYFSVDGSVTTSNAIAVASVVEL